MRQKGLRPSGSWGQKAVSRGATRLGHTTALELPPPHAAWNLPQTLAWPVAPWQSLRRIWVIAFVHILVRLDLRPIQEREQGTMGGAARESPGQTVR